MGQYTLMSICISRCNVESYERCPRYFGTALVYCTVLQLIKLTTGLELIGSLQTDVAIVSLLQTV